MANNDYIQFNVRDFPANVNLETLSALELSYFNTCGAVIFVLDAQVLFYISRTQTF